MVAPRLWSGWREVLVVVKPATVVAWRRRKFREYWAKLSGRPGPGRPPVSQENQDPIRQMSSANVTWGSPRIRSELRTLGIAVAKSTVERYMVKRGEFHTFVWAGPMFSKPIAVAPGEIVERDGFVFADVIPA